MKLCTTLSIASLCLVAFLFSSNASAQPWMKGVKDEKKASFHEVRQAFNQYWNAKLAGTKGDIPKGKGHKPFKRWEWFWEQRVDKDGAFPRPSIAMEEWQKYHSVHPGTAPTEAGVSPGEANLTGRWVSLGPSTSNGGYSGVGRLDCIAFHPSDPQTFWVGSPSGGLWKTTTGGASWMPLTDNLPVMGVSAIVVDPTNPDVLYIATGDKDHFATYSIGVLKSTNGGATWNTTGLSYSVSQGRKVKALIIHPSNPQLLIAATSDGIFRTTNGGADWTQEQAGSFGEVLFKPGDPSVVYASLEQGNAQVFRSVNTGDSWSQVSSFSNFNRIALAVTPAAPDLVGVLCSNASNNGFGGYYTSTNSGTTFNLVYAAGDKNLLGYNYYGFDEGGQAWYDLCLAISPMDANVVYAGGVNTWKSTNGGAGWTINTMWYIGFPTPTVHADKHYMAFSPHSPQTLFQCNDGGLYTTSDGGATWTDLSAGLLITQFYRLGNSATNPEMVIVGAQDNGTKLKNATVYTDVLGGDGMEAIVNYQDANVLYGSMQNGVIEKSTNGGLNWSVITVGLPSGAWVTPYVIDPVDPHTLYAGLKSEVYKTTDEGYTWTAISPSLVGGDFLRTLAVAPGNTHTLYAGSYWLLDKTTDGGAHWTRVTLPYNQSLTAIEVHPVNAEVLWITFSGYSDGKKVFSSADGGATWTNISGTLPNLPVNTIEYDKVTGSLYIGTDVGVFVRTPDMQDWQLFSAGLPNVIVNELEIQYNADHSLSRLRAATYGRGLWESELYSKPKEYCLPVYTKGCAFGDVINSFSFHTLVNSKSGCSNITEKGYTNYEPAGALTTSVSRGQVYELKLQAGKKRKQGFGVWIDFNGDKDFDDAGELVYASPYASKKQVKTKVLIPASSTAGATRLRVRSKYNATIGSENACTSMTYGESEDYTITILEAAAVPVESVTAPVARQVKVDEINAAANKLTAHPNPSATYFTLTLQSPRNEGVDLTVTDAAGRVVESRSNVAANGTLRLGERYKPGTYYAEVVQGSERVVVRLVKLP